MAEVLNGVETLPKISTGCVGRTNVTDYRQTDGRASGPDLGGSQGAQGPRPPTKGGPPTKPFNFYFALTIG